MVGQMTGTLVVGQDVIVPTILEGLSPLKALVTLVICI